MLGIALVALILGGIETWRLARHAPILRQKASEFRSLAFIMRTTAGISRDNKFKYMDRIDALLLLDDQAVKSDRRAAHFAEMGRKYELAVLRPWEVIPPDPPESGP